MAVRLGSSSRHGAHQLAQKLSTTTCPRSLARSTWCVPSFMAKTGAGWPICPGWLPRSQPVAPIAIIPTARHCRTRCTECFSTLRSCVCFVSIIRSGGQLTHISARPVGSRGPAGPDLRARESSAASARPAATLELTVIMPARNEQDVLPACLASLLAQDDAVIFRAGPRLGIADRG